MAKFASSKEAKVMALMEKKAEAVVATPSKPEAPFDVSKNVGIFAAVGIALGAIGTAVGSIASMLMSLQWWQFPILLFVAFVCVSGPSAFMAWLKLRKRTLGPLLEASGWAVNGQLPVNLPLGKALTSEAKLPANATRGGIDPLKQSSPTGKFLAVLVIAALLGLGYLGLTGKLDDCIQKLTAVEQPAETKATAESAK